jgi:hypothetical protein
MQSLTKVRKGLHGKTRWNDYRYVEIFRQARIHGHYSLWYLDLTVRGASSARGQRDCKHTPVLALLACEVEGCGACGEGDGRRESTSLPRKKK